MPYTNIKELPPYLKKYSEVVRRQWMHVWASVYNSTNDEARAFRAANSILKKRFKNKEQTWNKNESDYFSYLTDSWLKNIPG